MNIQILILVIFGSLYATASPTCSNRTVTPSRNTWALNYTGQLYSVYFCVTGSPQNITWSIQDSAGSNITLIQFPSSLGKNPCQPATPVPGYNATCQYNGSCYTTTFSVGNKLTASFNQSQLELKHGGSSCFAQNISLQACSSPTPNKVPVNPSSGVYNTQANFQCSHGSTLFNVNGTTGNNATKCLATAEWENEKIVQCLTAPVTTVPYNGTELKFYAIRKTYEQAKTACESDNAQLVVVKSKAMQDIITPHLDSTISYIAWGQYDYGVGYWMGLRKLAGANITDYKALNGTTYVNKPAYTNWNFDEPNAYKSQLACAYMCPYNVVYRINRADQQSDNALFNVRKGGWWTYSCTQKNYYICQRGFCATNPCFFGTCVALATSYKCKCNPGYSGSLCGDVPVTTVPYNGTELKFYAIRKTYEQAKTACESDNAQLVVVKSKAMQDIITPHLDSTISYIAWRQYDYDVGYWMGLRKLSGANIPDYKALDGTTYVNMPAYTNWNNDEPNHGKSQLACFCATNPCFFGTCVALSTRYKCNCDPGYSGSLCGDDVCFPEPCKNGGSCNRVIDNYTCSCLNGFVGRNCGTVQPTTQVRTTGGTTQSIPPPDKLGVIIGAVFGVVGALILIIILVYRIFIRPNKKDVTVAMLNPEM
ncbi:uncharacterized protein LOC100178545 [Ciona intestinalis]